MTAPTLCSAGFWRQLSSSSTGGGGGGVAVAATARRGDKRIVARDGGLVRKGYHLRCCWRGAENIVRAAIFSSRMLMSKKRPPSRLKA